MIYIENNGKISKLTTDTPFTLTHTPVRLFDLDYGYSPDALEELLNSGAYYQLLIDSLPVYGGEIVKAAIIWDEKAQGVPGGTLTTGAWRQRDLNTENDPDSLVSVASNAITMAVAGKYLVRAACPAYAVTAHQARILKNGTAIATGMTLYAHPSYGVVNVAVVSTVVTLAVNDVLKVEHRASSTGTTYGFGTDGGQTWGINVYSVVELIQLS